MRRFRLPLAATAGLVVTLAACGSVDTNTNAAPVLATVVGSVSNSANVDVATTDDVRVAVVWRGTAAGHFNVAEDLPVKAVFPAAFSIALDGPPPQAAMISETGSTTGPPPSATETSGPGPGATGPAPAGPDDAGAGDAQSAQSQPVALLDTPATVSAASQFAFGTVVAYLDQNHNGQLDLVGDNATAYVDQIVATNAELGIAYFEGPIPDSSALGGTTSDGFGHKPKDGYNLVSIPTCNLPSATPPLSAPNPVCPSEVVDAGPCPPIQWLDMDTPYTLSVATSPQVAALMCLSQEPAETDNGGAGGPEDPNSRPAVYPDPCDPHLDCAPDGSHYIFYTCVDISRGLCKGTLEQCTAVGFDRPTPIPADWPCLQ
jgi:hypothetical protein